jgi:quercetin dioxygenase-like cupin family protein
MLKMSLDAVAREQQRRAAATGNGRSAETVFGGHEKTLRQTVIALGAGRSLAEHESPGEATVLVLTGRVRLSTEGASWDGRRGDLLIVPATRHRLDALEDAAVMLTVAKTAGGPDAPSPGPVASTSDRDVRAGTAAPRGGGPP